MVQSVIQTSFHAGEWAPALNARVDLAKYKAGAALLRNFFVDYRGGASSRPGTRYVIQCRKSQTDVRLIPFQASQNVGYVLEFGDFYIRFIFQGAPVLETGLNITNVSGGTVTAANTYVSGDWVYITGVVGITNINGKYFIVDTATAANFTVKDLIGNSVTFSGTYVSGGTTSRIYTIESPYTAADLHLLKFTQNVDKLYIVHTNYIPYVLTLVTATNWTLIPISFGSTVQIPTNLVATSTNPGGGHFGWCVTAVDANGQESGPSTVAYATINTAAAALSTVNITWTAVSGAIAYNVYRTPESSAVNPPAGVAFGLITTVTAPNADDTFFSNAAQLTADYSISPPIAKNPFRAGGVSSVTVTAPGVYTTVPGVTFTAAPGGGVTATGTAVLGAQTAVINFTGPSHQVGQIFGSIAYGFVSVRVTSVDGSGNITGLSIVNRGSITSGSTPTNPVTLAWQSGTGVHDTIDVDFTWGVTSITITQKGVGYTSTPAITFSAGAAAATATLEEVIAGNPTAVGIFQQRLVLAAKPSAVQSFNMSQPGSYYNFDVSNPIQPDNAIEGTLASGDLNAIQSMASVPTGLIMLTSKANWLVSSGSGNASVTPIDIAAHAHSFNGASEVPPIIANFDILFVQAKGSIVRDLTFNFYTQIYTGTDISVLSSHLFYGHTILEWAWAEEPYKIVWAVRDDGTMLTLTFLKEQDLIGWSHSDTQGTFKSVAVITEPVSFGLTDAVYTVVERVIGDGSGLRAKYVERVAERIFTNGAADAWCVDAGLQYSGPPATTFSGAEHLGGIVVTGLADGVVIPPFTMPSNGTFTLATPASKVTIGRPFTPQLKTLQLDIGDPTIQGKRKGVNGVTVRVQDTLGLRIGKEFGATVVMKDLIVGNVGSQTNEIVNGLVTADARTIIDPSWDVPGQYCIEQLLPYPVTILGVIPEIEVGDTK